MSNSMILLVSVGTNMLRAKQESYDAILHQLEEHSGKRVLQVFTDDSTADAVSDGDERVYGVEEGIEEAIRSGAGKVLVVPVFMNRGELYNGLQSRLDFYRDRIEIKLADPVLRDQAACDHVEEILEQMINIDENKEYLLVAHGNPSYHAASYRYLQKSFDEKGHKNVKVVPLMEKDSYGQTITFLKARKADETKAQVVIIPLIVAWGDYMADILYNAQDSFMWNLRNAGYRTVFSGRGLGEHALFRAIYNDRLDEIDQ